MIIALIDYWEETFLPTFYKKDFKNIPTSTILKELAKEVAENFNKRKYLFLAELELWALANRDKKVRERTKKLYNKMLLYLEKIFSRAISNGEYKNLDPRMAALSVMTSMQGVIWFSIFEHNNFTAEEYINEVMNFIISGFKKSSVLADI